MHAQPCQLWMKRVTYYCKVLPFIVCVNMRHCTDRLSVEMYCVHCAAVNTLFPSSREMLGYSMSHFLVCDIFKCLQVATRVYGK